MSSDGGQRPGAGRHKLYAAPMVQLCFTLPQPHLDALKAEADSRDMSLAALVRERLRIKAPKAS